MFWFVYFRYIFFKKIKKLYTAIDAFMLKADKSITVTIL